MRGQVSLQSAVLLHPTTLVTGIPHGLTPGAWPLKHPSVIGQSDDNRAVIGQSDENRAVFGHLGHGGNDGPGVPHQVDHIDLGVQHPGQQPRPPEADCLNDPGAGLATRHAALRYNRVTSRL